MITSSTIKRLALAAASVAASLVVSSSASADWLPGDPFKYLQRPDLQTGMDVYATTPRILADDFLCTQTGPITDIHIWGSWNHDLLPGGSPNNVQFKLSFHDNVPGLPAAGVPSKPGALLWQTIVNPADFQTLLFAPATNELFYDPQPDAIIGQDTQVWEYNFTKFPIPAFIQQGTAANPKIYWLDVQAQPLAGGGQSQFGWKTSLDGFNSTTLPPGLNDDDAVWGNAPFGGNPGNWTDMHYPLGTVNGGKSINQAFVLTTTVPEPASLGLLTLTSYFLMRRPRRA